LNRLKDEFIKDNCFYNNINLKTFNNLDKIIKIKVLKHLVNIMTDNTVEVSYIQYNQMIGLCSAENSNKSLSIGKDFDFVKEYEYIFIEKKVKIEKKIIEVNGYGEYFVNDNDSFILSENKISQYSSNFIELCYNNKVFPLYLRNRKNGDTMTLKIGTKKVKDILIDQKIPLSIRDKMFVVADSKSVLWIPGIKKSLQDNTSLKKIYIYEVK